MKESKKVGAYHILLNEILGKFFLLTKGSGSFANTYKAYKDKDKQTIYACKTINKEIIKSSF